MDRELTLHPQNEHARDLVYSEYSSCDRSVHLLIQESPSVPYDVLLRVYRETVSAYLSCEEIRPPEDFIENLLARFDGLAESAGLPIDAWRALGMHLLLRARNAYYIVTTRETEALVRSGDSLVPVGEACDSVRLRFDRGAIQRELFASRLGDLLTALRLDPARIGGADIVLGCAETDRGAVLDGLSNPVWLDPEPGSELRASRRSIVSGSLSRRVLVLNFGGDPKDNARPGEGAKRAHRLPALHLSRRRVVGAAVLVAVLAAALAFWIRSGPQRHGASRSPVAAGETAAPVREEPRPSERTAESPQSAPAWQLTEAWRRTFAGPVTSSPVLAGGKVIFGCRDGAVYAVDPVSGSTVWTFKASGGVGASPAPYGDAVIVADYNGWVYALGIGDGEPLWKAKLAASVVSSPAVSGDRVLVCGVDGYANCLSAADGAVVWKKRTGGRIRGSAAAADGSFFVPSYDGYLYSFYANLGTSQWRAALGGPVSATPAVRGGSVVIGGPDGKVVCLDAKDGAERWNFAAGDAVKSSLAISGDGVLFGSNDGCVYCVSLPDGALLWKYQTGGIVLARPAERDGVVYAGSYDGRMYCLSRDGGRLLGAFEAGGEIFSSPAADEDRVYFGTNGGDFVALRRGRSE